MQLKKLLEGFCPSLAMESDKPVSGLTLDSRQAVAGNLFIALAGSRQHGLTHAEQALLNGACAVVFDPAGNGKQLAEQINAAHSINNVPIIAIDNLSFVVGDIAARFYGQPSRLLNVIGITGTNGKTSCSQFLGQLLDDCGIIGTLGWGEWGKLNKTLNTTPDAVAIQKILAELVKLNKRAVAMEVSSHGLEQRRVNGVYFKGAVFTNISRDHLDYHGTMEAYLQAKLALLNKPGLEFAVVNLDDAYSKRIIAAIPESVTIWGVSAKGLSPDSGESVVAENILYKEDGIEFDIRWTTAGMQDDCTDAGDRATQGAVAELEQCREQLSTTVATQQNLLKGAVQRVVVPLYGNFNSENILCVLAVLLAMGVSLADAADKLTQIKPVAGRMERFGGKTAPLVFVDYAHTPDALEKVLSSLRKHCHGALWVVFGCGGNRDAGKRPQMGSIAAQWADHVIITDDNPRFENSRDIINDILAGCGSTIADDCMDAGGTTPGMEEVDSRLEQRSRTMQGAIVDDCMDAGGRTMQGAIVEIIENREQAIHYAIARADDNDCIVIAGKGHEDYQEINGVQHPFSDQQVVIDALKMRNGKV